MHRLARVLILGIFCITWLGCGAPPEPTEPTAGTRSAQLLNAIVGNTTQNTAQAKTLCCVTPSANLILHQFVMPPLPSAGTTQQFSIEYGAAFLATPTGPPGLNRVSLHVFREGSFYRAQTELFWDCGNGTQCQSDPSALYALAFPGDLVTMWWRGHGQGANSFNAMIEVDDSTGHQRTRQQQTNWGFVNTQYPNALIYPSFLFSSDSSQSCQDMPGGGSLHYLDEWGQEGSTTFTGPFGTQPLSSGNCGVLMSGNGDGSLTVTWRTH